jgi:galactofuranosylgalactofuranosylrhamnosyl-N-acetylglucosaminyl-diphospho-decaprenol beta-1,5/1,6-galactofuranosyltransferase
MRLRWFTLSTLVKHWIHRPSPDNLAQPEVEFGKNDAQWWRVPAFDSALVSSADGSGKNVYTRDRAQYRRMLRDSYLLHRRLRRNWPKLQSQYRAALPDLVSDASWQQTFEEQA